MKEQEKQLIEKVLKGDTASFGYFVEAYQNMAFTIAYRICKNKQDAEDIVQESFIRAFNSLRTFKFSSKFSTWLYRIVYNTAIATIQQVVYRTDFTDYNQLNIDSGFLDLNALDRMENEEKTKTIDRVMEMLPPDEAVVLTLFYLEENSIKEVAEMTSVTESNVKVRLHRARKRFGELISSMSVENILR